jgi:hypothetical protein
MRELGRKACASDSSTNCRARPDILSLSDIKTSSHRCVRHCSIAKIASIGRRMSSSHAFQEQEYFADGIGRQGGRGASLTHYPVLTPREMSRDNPYFSSKGG